jgi:glycosyltransferase involved in cell wall biosynthesis
VASALGYPVVVHLRAALPEHAGAWRSALVRRAVAHADAAVAINDDVAASYGRPRNLAVVPNPVRLPPNGSQPAAAARDSLGLPADRLLVGLVGHFYAAKGWRQLLEAVARLAGDGLDVGLVLAGRPLRTSAWHRSPTGRVLGALAGREDAGAEIAAEIRRLGLVDRVHDIGWQEDVARVYAALDVVCAPSQGPELSRPVLEAQAHGRAVVAVSRTGGGIVQPGVTGVLVERASPGALAAALGPLARDVELRRRLGAAARAHAEREYSLEVVGRRLIEVYDRVRTERAPA